MTKDRISQVTSIAKAIADETRVRVLMALRGRELCVCQLQALVGLAPSTVSEHLLQLRQAGLVASRKRGRWVYYRLADIDAGRQVSSVLAWLEQNLSSDGVITADKTRLAHVLSMPAEQLCRIEVKPSQAPPSGLVEPARSRPA